MSILTRAIATADLEVRSDGRTLEGTAITYGEEAHIVEFGQRYTEVFARGAFAGIEPGTIALTAKHPRTDAELPIGVTVEFNDEPLRLRGAWHVSDTELGNEILALATDRVPLGLSVGFIEVAGGSRWNRARTRVERLRAALDHIAVVRSPAYAGARVTGVRTATASSRPRLAIAHRRW
jgi:HK97 family phage prohead protease